MGTAKKEVSRKERQGKVNDGMTNVKTKGENFYRSAKRVKSLNSFKGGKAQRNAAGEITKEAAYQSREKPSARVEPNRKWFTNTRVISQDALTAFRGAIAEQKSDPYSYLLKQNKLPLSLISDSSTKNGIKQHQAKMTVQANAFADTFGPKAQRKRVKLGVGSLEDLAGEAVKTHQDYLGRIEEANLLRGHPGGETQDQEGQLDDDGEIATAREPIFSKGQSERIWAELHKVIDASDVVVHVLDARDPLGTRCRSVEKHIREEAPHKHLVFLLNKCDLVPAKVAAQWVRILSAEYPTLAFHASITNSFGKGSLISLLRQFSTLHSNRKQISVGFIGYPNTGKSSIINTLRKKKVCTVAPIPGETKYWQYITLMKRIYLIDCPGIVPPNQGDSEEDILLKGVVRVENVQDPAQYVAAALSKCRLHHVERMYGIRDWTDATDFLERLARKSGRLLKGGEPDLDGVGKMVLNDFLRGKLPWFVPPPAGQVEQKAQKEVTEGEHAVLQVEGERSGTSGTKRKREHKEEEEEEEETKDLILSGKVNGEDQGTGTLTAIGQSSINKLDDFAATSDVEAEDFDGFEDSDREAANDTEVELSEDDAATLVSSEEAVTDEAGTLTQEDGESSLRGRKSKRRRKD